ncbi:hypothetical protein GGI43DRAFT_377150 [Trichoderma evansii]
MLVTGRCGRLPIVACCTYKYVLPQHLAFSRPSFLRLSMHWTSTLFFSPLTLSCLVYSTATTNIGSRHWKNLSSIKHSTKMLSLPTKS